MDRDLESKHTHCYQMQQEYCSLMDNAAVVNSFFCPLHYKGSGQEMAIYSAKGCHVTWPQHQSKAIVQFLGEYAEWSKSLLQMGL